MGESFQVPLGEYSKVKEDDGKFCEGDEEFVDDLASVPELEGLLALIITGGWQSVHTIIAFLRSNGGRSIAWCPKPYCTAVLYVR